LAQSVSRKVYFFELADKNDFLPLIEGCISEIADLPFNDQGRYLPTTDADNVLVLFISSTSYPLKLQFGRVRRSDLPLIENAGQISPLKIAQGAGIMDWAHLILFEDGILAAEFNRDAPRISRLGDYLYFKGKNTLPSAVRFKPLFQRAILEELERFQTVTALTVEASTLDADAIKDADRNLGQAFLACRKAGHVKKARIMLKTSVNPQSDLKSLARRLFTNQRSRESLTTLKLTGRTDVGRKPLDLLENYLISSEDFMKVDSRSRAIDPEDAFRVLNRAYLQNRSRFASAATADDPW
jgi:hypothetical protein